MPLTLIIVVSAVSFNAELTSKWVPSIKREMAVCDNDLQGVHKLMVYQSGIIKRSLFTFHCQWQ